MAVVYLQGYIIRCMRTELEDGLPEGHRLRHVHSRTTDVNINPSSKLCKAVDGENKADAGGDTAIVPGMKAADFGRLESVAESEDFCDHLEVASVAIATAEPIVTWVVSGPVFITYRPTA